MDNPKIAYQLRENFGVYLKLKGFDIHRRLPESTCLYDCIAAATSGLNGLYWTTLSINERLVRQQEVRDALASHMRANKNRYMEYFSVDTIDGMSKEELEKAKEDKIESVKKVTYWGGKESMIACTEFYKKRVIVERLKGGRFLTGSTDNDDIIYLASFGNRHYNLLTKRLNPEEPDRDILSLYFDKVLRLQGLDYVYRNNSNENILDTLSVALTNKAANTENFKVDLKIRVKNNLSMVVQKYLGRMRGKHPQDFSNSGRQIDEQDEQNKLDVMDYVTKLLDEPENDEKLLIQLAVDMYEKVVIVHQPLKRDRTYRFNKDIKRDAVHLALDQGQFYSALRKTLPQEEEDDDVTFIDPHEKEVVSDNIELTFIMSNVLKNVRTAVYVVFLVPGQRKEESLAEALRSKPELIRHLVVYSNDDLNNLKADKELRQVCTLYANKFTMPMNLDLIKRLQRLASFLIPPLFLTVCNKTTWHGIRYEVYTKFSKTSFVSILLTHLWPCIRTNVMADVNKLINAEVDILCNGCKPECELASVQAHYDATKFLKMMWEAENATEFLDGFTDFKTKQDDISNVMAKIQDFYDTPEPLNYMYLSGYLSSTSLNSCRTWSTYFVLHLDGPNMDAYPKAEDHYYEILNDPSVERSVYVGKTTDSVFRFSHFVSTTSLNQVFTKTSRLFMLRSEKFLTPDLAEQDEAMMIEIITAWMESWSKRRKKANFLFLNHQAQPSSLLSVVGKDEPKRWAELAASDIHILNFSPDDTEKFNYTKFQANFRKLYELDCVGGNFKNRTFRSLKLVYQYIRFRQP